MKTCGTILDPVLRLLALATVFAAGLQPARAQQDNRCDAGVVIPEAERHYRVGHFDYVLQTLPPCIKSGFAPSAQVQAYKVLALTYLELDSAQLATQAVNELLRINPNYEPEYFALPQFKELVSKQKIQIERVVQITSVSKKAENLPEVPATVTLITQEDILKRGYRDLTQVLHDIPGFDVIRGNGPGYLLFYQRGYRSTGNDRSILLVDGIEENDLQSDNIQFSRQYPISNIERIEVIYGPASTMYGANAFMGVINVITKKSLDQPYEETGKINWKASGQMRHGSLGTSAIDGMVTARGKSMAVSVTGRYFRSNEMDLSEFPEWNFGTKSADDYLNKLAITNGAAINTFLTAAQTIPSASHLYSVNYQPDGSPAAVQLTEAGRTQAAELDNRLIFGNVINGTPIQYNNHSANWMLRTKIEFNDFTLSVQTWKTDEGAAPWYTNQSRLVSSGLSRWVWQNSALSLAYEKAISENLLLQSTTSYRLHELSGATNLASYRGYFNNALPLLELLKGTEPTYSIPSYFRASNQLRNEVRLLWTPTVKLDVNSGIELRNSIIQGNYITSLTGNPQETGTPDVTLAGGDSFRVFDLGLFSQMTYNWTSNLKAVAGGRLDFNRIRSNGGYGFVFNPRLSLVYSQPKFIVKAIFAEAFKDASYLQKYGTTAGRLLNNPTLQPEKVRNLELSVHLRVLRNLTGSFSVYRANYSNAVGTAVVSLPDGGTTTQFQALGRQVNTGVQGEVKYTVSKFNFWGNFTHNRPIDLSSTEKLRVSDVAGLMFNSGATGTLHRYLAASLNSNFVGVRYAGAGTSGSNNPITRFPSYFLLNGALTAPDLAGKFSLQLQINNLLNKAYFHPGIRLADGVSAASRFPQERRTFSIALYYNAF